MELETSVSKIPLVGPAYTRKLKKLDIKTIKDLLYHVPRRYLDFRNTSKIKDVQVGQIFTIKGQVVSMKNQYTKSGKKMQLAEVWDKTGKIKIVWFNQPFLVKSIKKGTNLACSGEVSWFGRDIAMISPEYEIQKSGNKSVHTGRLVPIYPETAGVSSKWLRSRITKAYQLSNDNIKDKLPENTAKDLGLADLTSAIKMVHFPKDKKEAEKGRERLAFDELFVLQLKSLIRKIKWKKNKVSHKLDIKKEYHKEFEKELPFDLTDSQEKSIKEIFEDLKKELPMNRLLEGDVGSGKTVVAAAAFFACFKNGYKSALMAPTQILAEQHFKTLKETFQSFDVCVELITSSTRKKTKDKDTNIYVGTHALIHKEDIFDAIALVAIDEQHRFGVKQRGKLIQKSRKGNDGKHPHVLTMTATPIPRTVALTAYGDLDLSVLDELPKGRKPITTWLVPPEKRDSAHQWIKEKIEEETVQAFVICPLIEESDKEIMDQVKAVTKEHEKLKKAFPELKIGLLHGKLKTEEKNQVIDKFKSKKLDILVSTPVVEVGIDVPNATIMLIEDADRFGLAQLHQLRGRVGRGEKKSYCLLFTSKDGEKIERRLNALKETKSGFELAELDLRLRGPGEVFGTKQHGFPELKVATWSDFELIKKARNTAQDFIQNQEKYSEFFQKIEDSKIALN